MGEETKGPNGPNFSTFEGIYNFTSPTDNESLRNYVTAATSLKKGETKFIMEHFVDGASPFTKTSTAVEKMSDIYPNVGILYDSIFQTSGKSPVTKYLYDSIKDDNKNGGYWKCSFPSSSAPTAAAETPQAINSAAPTKNTSSDPLNYPIVAEGKPSKTFDISQAPAPKNPSGKKASPDPTKGPDPATKTLEAPSPYSYPPPGYKRIQRPEAISSTTEDQLSKALYWGSQRTGLVNGIFYVAAKEPLWDDSSKDWVAMISWFAPETDGDAGKNFPDKDTDEGRRALELQKTGTNKDLPISSKTDPPAVGQNVYPRAGDIKSAILDAINARAMGSGPVAARLNKSSPDQIENIATHMWVQSAMECGMTRPGIWRQLKNYNLGNIMPGSYGGKPYVETGVVGFTSTEFVDNKRTPPKVEQFRSYKNLADGAKDFVYSLLNGDIINAAAQVPKPTKASCLAYRAALGPSYSSAPEEDYASQMYISWRVLQSNPNADPPADDRPIVKPTTPQPTARPAAPNFSSPRRPGQDTQEKITDYYHQVCAVPAAQDVPVDFSVNVVRMPFVSPARKNSNEMQFFLNNIPSVFASKMSPYFDIELQMPFSDPSLATVSSFASKPSLFRFLEGSIDFSKSPPLTEADKSMLQVAVVAPPRGGGGSAAFGISDSATVESMPSPNKASFVGRELFTSPQILTDMDRLGIDASRITPVKPFLPMATILGANISIANAGAGSFAHKKATVDLKVHDKARLVEFSEAFRGPAGFRDVTVWLTYGWLAPRGLESDDMYAKFINENMLVKEAYQIINSGYSFDNLGQVTVKLDLVVKGMSTLQKGSIQLAGKNLAKRFSDTREILSRIRRNRAAFGDAPTGFNKEIRIFQYLDSAVDGDLTIDIKDAEFDLAITEAKTIVKDSKKFNNSQRQQVTELLTDLEKLFSARSNQSLLPRYSGLTRDGYKGRTQDTAKLDMVDKFSQITNKDSPDPFLPVPEKNTNLGGAKIFADNLITEVDRIQGDKIFGTQYINNGAEATFYKDFRNFKRKTVSFGKIFSVFCLPPILEIARQEGVDEVQVNFYMLNESCGPVSLHNVAEFPIEAQMIADQFAAIAAQRGGETMTIQEFLNFIIENQFGDNRAPGYGMHDYYRPYSSNHYAWTRPVIVPKLVTGLPGGAKKVLAEGSAEAEQAYMTQWFYKYGEFKRPDIAMKIETVLEGTNTSNRVDLLSTLQNSAADMYKDPVKIPGKKLIKRIHIYDKKLNPYYEQAKLFKDEDGDGWTVYENAQANEVTAAQESIRKEFNNQLENLKTQKGKTKTTPGAPTVDVERAPNGTVVAVNIVAIPETSGSEQHVVPPAGGRKIIAGKDALKDLVRNTLPTITPGVNGSLVSTATITSKTDGLMGTINMQGGSFRAKSDLTPNGMAMEAHNLPMRVLPANLTFSSLGCPLADLYQHFFVDFNTGTTLDNLYACSQIQHSFTPGKFQTNWTFIYADGYGQFYGANKFTDEIKKFVADAAKPAEV